jgi:hypothetical protein
MRQKRGNTYIGNYPSLIEPVHDLIWVSDVLGYLARVTPIDPHKIS